ncbi:MAG: hypothetical protein KKH52_01110 [Nanoarchaeota archaeon]|nr:hypothetical protein [Nanoarchaeota archaeon]
MKDTKYIFNVVFPLILALLMLTSCQNQQLDELQEEMGEVKDKIEETTETIAKNIKEEVNEIKENVEAASHSSEVVELIEKSEKVNSYHYSFISLIRQSNNNYEEVATYQAYLKGDKIKKIYLSPVKLNQEFYYIDIYLNINEKTAVGTCSTNSVLCDDLDNQAFKLVYTSEKISPTPLDLLSALPLSAQKIGEETIENRKAAVLSYTNSDGKLEKLSVDTYSGIPLKQIIYQLEDDEEVVLEKNTFSLDGLNDVKNADVTLPDNYELIE